MGCYTILIIRIDNAGIDIRISILIGNVFLNYPINEVR